MEFFDSHVHLDDGAFDADREAMIDRARAAGIVEMVTVGTSVASSRAAVALAERHPDVFAAVAVHPHAAAEATETAMRELAELATHPKVVAIGETGLDFVREQTPRQVQAAAFYQHLALSASLDLPVIIHCREAYPEVVRVLEEERITEVIMHAFSGSGEMARRCVERGYSLSLAGPVTFRNARMLAAVARAVPLERLLVETDAPVLSPEPFRGRRNEPAYLPRIVAQIAALRDTDVAQVASATTANARRIYHGPRG